MVGINALAGTILQLLVSGLLLGGIYALMSVGLTLIFGTMRVVNFAHGEFLMLGMYSAYFLWKWAHIDPYIALLIVAPGSFLVGIIVERVIIRRTIGGPEVTQIFATLGLSILLQNGALYFFSGDYRSVTTSVSTAAISLGSIRIPQGQLISAIVATVLAAGLYVFLKRTLVGAAIRATAQHRGAAALMGINVQRIYAVTFALGTMAVAVAGCLVAPLYSVYPRVGFDFLLIAFVTVVLGGLGSVSGAFVASVVMGLLVSFVSYYFGATNAQLAYFVLFMIVLAVRPAGLFGQRGAEVYQES